MANEFKIKHGFISTGNGEVQGTLDVSTGININAQPVATRAWVTGTALASYATSQDVTDAINALVDSAPGTLNTLNELAAALGDDASFSTTITNSIATKLPLAGGNMTGNINWTSTDKGLVWTMNTDGAYIKFFNTGDGDTNSRLEYATSDNGNEYHRFMVSGIERMAITASGISATGYNKSNWDTAYGWGNHASAGYQSSGTYVTYASSRIVGDASAILTTSISPWDISTASDAPTGSVDGILTTGMWDWNGWATQSYHDFHTNTIYVRSRQNSVWQSSWATIYTTDNFTDNSTNWNAAYNWGDHAGLYLGATAKAADSELLDGLDSSAFLRSNAADTATGALTFSGGLNMSNSDITNVNSLTIGDPGPGEGIIWNGGNIWKIYESPNNLTTNSAGNLQFVKNSTRVMTIGTDSVVEVVGATRAAKYISADGGRLSLGILDLNDNGTPAQFRINTTIPWPSGSADFTVNIKGFAYGNSEMVSLSIGWHHYNNTFYNENAITNGSWSPEITLARDPNDLVVIHLSGGLYWPKLYVESLYSSSYQDQFSAGWSWVDQDLADCTDIAIVPYRSLDTSISGNAGTATTLQTTRNIALSGAVTGNANFNGGGNITITTTATSDPTLTINGDASGSATFTNLGNATLTLTIADDSHNHTIANVDGLQAALDAKQASGNYFTDGDTVLNMANNDGFEYDDVNNRMYVKLDGTNREIYHEGNFTPSNYLSTTGKAADSNLLDGIDSGSFLRSDANDTASGNLYFSSSYNRFNTGNSNNTSTADTVGVYLHQSGYTDGRWTTRLRKYDHGGGVPLYIDNSAATANVFTAAARFGTYSGNGYTFEVFGAARVGGDFAASGQINASGGNSSQWNTAYGWGDHAAAGYGSAGDTAKGVEAFGWGDHAAAGYITDGNTNWNNSYGFITASDSITGNAATATKLATARNIALAGDVTGSANFDGSANISITATVANDSHTHDGRYYTESESDARFVNVTGDTVTGNLAVSGATLSVTSTAAGSEAFYVDGVNGRLFTISDDLSDSLFSVNTISGLPVIEAFADNTVKIGPFSNPVTVDSSGALSIGGVTAATQTYVDNAISGLIGGAPGALDTLNELAAAINDDASYASTITTALGTKAPLASPALTGTPTAPTAAAATNSTQIATTAFVKAQGYLTSIPGHTHSIGDIDGLQNELDGKQPAGSYASSTHTHTFASLTSKPTTLSGYGITDAASSTHSHTFASLTSKPTTLSGYGITDAASSTHTHTFASLTSTPTTLAGYGITDAASSSHNHDSRYMRADTDANTAGAIRINGSYSYGTYTAASNYKTGADNLVLKGNASGVSGIFFESEKDGTNINHPSDFGFIQYSAYGTGTSGESNELIIGVSNDADDHLVFNAPDTNGLKFRVGASTTDNTVYHSGNLTLATLGYTGATNANYITNNNQLTNGAGYITGYTETDTLASVIGRGNLFGTANQGYITANAGTYASELRKIRRITMSNGSSNWDNDNHCFISTDSAGNFADSLSINSYNDITLRIDTNSNNAASYVRFGQHGTGASTYYFVSGYDGAQYITTITGDVVPGGDRLYNLGQPDNRWRIVFCETLDSAGLHESNLASDTTGFHATGTVLVWKDGEAVPCTTEADHMKIGVAVFGNASPLVQGAEPVLVSGEVKEGDYLITSEVVGHAKAVSRSYVIENQLLDCVIGKALETASGESHLVKTWVTI